MKSVEETMNILEAYDLTRSCTAAAGLAGCSHHTVARYVQLREQGLLPDGVEPARRERVVDPFMGKIEEWVDRSGGKVRADVAFDKLRGLGFDGSERTVRRAVAEVKLNHRRGQRRVFRPWLPEPGMWAQWDWGQGPQVAGRPTVLFCAWLAWSRFRVTIPCWDRTMPTLIACLDRAMRAFGGCPTYWLTDNEKTVTIEHVAGIPVRNPRLLEAAIHYGVTVATCVPCDPATKGGVERSVLVAKADLVPTDANLLPAYTCWVELVDACERVMSEVNGRPHTVTRRPPAEMRGEEQQRLHRLPERPFTTVFGETRKVSWSSTISWGGVAYSVPHTLADETVWARADGEHIVVVHVGDKGPEEVARHRQSTPGQPQILDEHYPPRPAGSLDRRPKPQSPAEQAFLAIGPGAGRWLIEAAAVGTVRIRVKMAEAVDLAAMHGGGPVDEALGTAALVGRFAEGDLASLLANRLGDERATASEDHSLQPGTSAWKVLG